MDYNTLTLPSNVQYPRNRKTKSNYSTHLTPLFFRQGNQVETIFYPTDYMPDSSTTSKDGCWHVLCDLINSDKSQLAGSTKVIYSLVPKPPQTGDNLHVTHMIETHTGMVPRKQIGSC